MKSLLTFILVFLTTIPGISQVESIADAKARGVDAVVTVTGVVTNGNELGVIRYIQDQTGGLAIYDGDKMANIIAGDSITVTGTLKDYNGLLEIDPVSSVTIELQEAHIPEPVELTPAQLGEAYEGMLVRVSFASFEDAGATFASKTNYSITANGESGQVRISDDASPFIGAVIPSGEAIVTGVLSQFGSTYQILVRKEADIAPSSSINFVTPPFLNDLSTSGFTLSWETDSAGTTEMFYGHTPDLELGHVTEAGTGTSHSLTISGAEPSQLFYIWPFSVKDKDTARISTKVYITQSVSSGDMKAFFNRSVDHSVSLGRDAVQLDHAIDDTLISYINRAQESIDFTIYNFNNTGITNIAEALNAAHDRGVVVRVVYDINQNNFGTDELNGSIGKMASPVSEYPITGIMHNKFVVFDALSEDPNLPVVWTGATNFTDGQINVDPNNVVVIQDQSLAIAYRLEFNEMFGSEDAQPDPSVSRFGPFKKDDTPHEFLIGGHRVECYFSPSDPTHTKILETIRSADTDLSIATMLITKSDIAYAIRDRFENGVPSRVLINQVESSSDLVVSTLRTALQENFKEKGEAGIMHHKYAIIDQSDPDSDPILLTGSHNWSTSAQTRNDENTLIIHNQEMANQYYQEFVTRFKAGLLLVDAPVCQPEFVTMSSGTSYRYDVLYNDEIPGPVVLEINRQPSHGSARIESDQTLTYVPDPGFNQNIDTVYYKASMEANTNISDSSMMVVYVNLPVGINDFMAKTSCSIYPNPSHGEAIIHMGEGFRLRSLSLHDMAGRVIFSESSPVTGEGIYTLQMDHFPDGFYYVILEEENADRTVLPLVLRK